MHGWGLSAPKTVPAIFRAQTIQTIAKWRMQLMNPVAVIRVW